MEHAADRLRKRRVDRAVQFRRRAAARVADGAYIQLARAGALVPMSRPEWHGLERIPNVPYKDGGHPAHTLDVWRRRGDGGAGKKKKPIVLYVHGGAFRALSKETHWLMGLIFARRGYVLFNVDYRLAPHHRFPDPLADVCDAYSYVVREAERWGGDPEQMILAGESAGANLATAMTVTACYRRPESWAKTVWNTGVVPKAVLPACGIYQISDHQRISRRKKLPWYIADQIAECAEGYLPPDSVHPEGATELADPLLLFERGTPPDRPLPPFYLPVGTRDPLLDDTRRMATALSALGTVAEARYFPGEIHAFHALIYRKAARQCWREMIKFLETHVTHAGK
jgi:acetyl esterase